MKGSVPQFIRFNLIKSDSMCGSLFSRPSPSQPSPFSLSLSLSLSLSPTLLFLSLHLSSSSILLEPISQFFVKNKTPSKKRIENRLVHTGSNTVHLQTQSFTSIKLDMGPVSGRTVCPFGSDNTDFTIVLHSKY